MNKEQFAQYLDEELGWRKKELTDLYFFIEKEDNETLMKTMILMLYAHWEGYIKKSSKLYLKFVSEQKRKLKDLTNNFKAIRLKEAAKRCINMSESLSLSGEIDFMNRYISSEEQNFKLKIDIDNDRDKSIIDTQDNLKPAVLKNIMNIIGLKYNDALETRKVYIDSNLLGNRNVIGHGSRFQDNEQVEFALSVTDIKRLKDIIIYIIDTYTDTLKDYVEYEYYLAINSEQKEEYDIRIEEEMESHLKSIEESYMDNELLSS